MSTLQLEGQDYGNLHKTKQITIKIPFSYWERGLCSLCQACKPSYDPATLNHNKTNAYTEC